jgi:thermolysin metallopeptidase-like protein
MGDDDPAVQAISIDRDLENPNFDCWNSTTSDLDNYYARGGPLRRWFFLITEGDATIGIDGFGLDKAMSIVLESVNFLNYTSDVDEFVDATIGAVYSYYGPCSAEANVLRAAWSEVCVDIPIDCNFSIIGPASLCEEDDQLTMFISGGPGSSGNYVWYFPYEWTVPGSQGNSYYGSVLYVTDFPKYNWYPRYFTITVKLLGSGGGPDKKINVKLVDCNGDDPTCEEYYGLQGGGTNGRSTALTQTDLLDEKADNEIAKVKVFDITGKLLFEGSVNELRRKRLFHPGILVLAYFDELNKFIRAEKMTITR